MKVSSSSSSKEEKEEKASSLTQKWSRVIALVLLTITSTTALLTCPHSKVEESFNIQATHDLYYYGITPALFQKSSFKLWKEKERSCSSDYEQDEEELPYDHLKYPGVVPRTFAGPLILSAIVRFLALILSPAINLYHHPMIVQMLSRLTLLSFNIHSLWRLACASDFKFGSPDRSKKTTNCLVGTYFLLITACQFHLPYYGSRMLPNVMALPFVIHSYAYWLRGNIHLSSSLLVVAAAVFRCDIIILLFTVGLCMLLCREMTILHALKIGITSGFIALIMTVPFDSILWQRIVWPEGEVLFFNTVENKSSEWGRSPWHWYGSRALPRAMLCTAFLVPLSFVRLPEHIASWEWEWRRQRQQQQQRLQNSKDKKSLPLPPKIYRSDNGKNIKDFVDGRVLKYLIPILSFVALYSFLPHKEMRFIFPAIPMLNVAAAIGLARLHEMAFSPTSLVRLHGKDKEDQKHFSPSNKGGENDIVSYSARFFFACGILAIFLSFIGSAVFLLVSQNNYPGGDALQMLKTHVEQQLTMKRAAVHQGTSMEDNENVKVYIDVASSMSGVSLFGQRSASSAASAVPSTTKASKTAIWTFEKSGYEQENQFDENNLSSEEITHCLSENKTGMNGFHVVGIAYGSPRVDFRKLRIHTEETIYILEKDGWGR